MELVPGQIVFSRRGRDTGRTYVVAGIEGERVLLVNGTKFTLASPKRKNIRHINPTGTVLPGSETQADTHIKAALAAYTAAAGKASGGQKLV